MSFRATETDSIREPRTVGVRAFLGYLEEVATDTYRPTTSRAGATHMHALLEDGDIHVVPLGPDTGGVVQRMVGDTVILYATLPPPVPAWPVVDADIEVFPGDDLVAIVNAAPAGSDIYLHRNLDGTRATYEIAAPVKFADAVLLRAALPEMTIDNLVLGTYYIDPWVTISTTTAPQIFDADGVTTPTLYGLRITGAKYDGADTLTGRGIHRGTGWSISHCKFDNNENAALGGNWSGTVTLCELTENSIAAISGISAASKTTEPCTFDRCFFHDDYNHGVWVDCDAYDFVATHCHFKDEGGTGLFYEISKGPGLVEYCLFEGCNTGGTAGRGGMIVTSSKGLTVDHCEFDGNNVQNLRIWEDSRFQNGANGCTSGYYLEGITVSNCTIGAGNPVRLLFNGGSTINVTADATYATPHGSAPAGAEVVFTGNTY